MQKVSLLFICLCVAATSFAQATHNILNFQSPTYSTTFQYFGSSLEGTLTEVVTNPAPSSGNTSSKVTKYVKPAGAEVWAGAFTNPNPTKLMTVTGGALVKIKVRMDHIGSVTLKLEGSTSWQDNWIHTVSNTQVNAWETLTFNTAIPSFEGQMLPAHGTYTRLVVFFDFGTAGGSSDVTSYFDDVVVIGGIPDRTVKFAVNMNGYSGGTFGTAYLSGWFNGWSGDLTPLADPDGDGIWRATKKLPDGEYEYKVSLDNWSQQEVFAGGESCTRTTGSFTNRLITVTGNLTVPLHCWNACVNRPATPVSITGPSTVCDNEMNVSYSIDSIEGATSYSWLVPTGATIASGQGTTAITVNFGTANGTVKVRANGDCGNSAYKTKAVAVGCAKPMANGRSDDFGSELTIFPNPAQDEFSVNFVAAKAGQFMISLMDMTGRLVYDSAQRTEEGVNEATFPIEELAPGVYTVVFELDGEKTVQKLIVQ